MRKMTRGDVIRKCLIVFEAIRRHASKGNAGLEAAQGAEEEFEMDSEICEELREILREMEAGAQKKTVREEIEDLRNELRRSVMDLDKTVDYKSWQKDIMMNGTPKENVL